MERDLEIDDDPAFDDRWHHVQRAGWGLLGIFLLASAFGFLGPSRLSTRTASSGPTTVDYPRYLRRNADSELKVSVKNPSSERDEIWVSKEYLDKIKLEKISPEPVQTTFVGDGIVYTFAAREGASSLDVLFEMKPDHAGLLKGEVRLGNSPEKLAFNQIVYF